MGKTPVKAAKEPTIEFYKSVRMACDFCRAKKVRCGGSQPCSPCLKRSLRCTYLHIPKKKGPRASPNLKCIRDCPNVESLESDSRSETTPASHASQLETESDIGSDSGCCGSDFGAQESSIIMDDTELMIPFIVDIGTDKIVELETYSDISLDESSEKLPKLCFYRFVELFFTHLYPIMPILDPGIFLDVNFFLRPEPLTSDQYSLLTALSAITTVQLNLSSLSSEQVSSVLRPEVLIQQCLQERARDDRSLEEPTTITTITSFFLFGYYGNMEMHSKSRYYLQQAITFAEMINLGDETVNSKLSKGARQWRRRLFWLLFITERAYALQCRLQIRILNPTVPLPKIFDSDNPRLLYGFVALANLFCGIDKTFMAFWSCGGNDKPTCSESWLKSLQSSIDTSTFLLSESIETQRVDISVSRLWLQVLLWQMGVTCGLITLDASDQCMNLSYPIKLAKDLIMVTSMADQSCLNAHGIGMEQKLADIGHCLIDVLKCTSTRLHNSRYAGGQYLASILQRLSHIRGRESHYLQPLLLRAKTLFTYPARPLNLPPPVLVPSPSEAYQEHQEYESNDENQIYEVTNMPNGNRSEIQTGLGHLGLATRALASIGQAAEGCS